VIEVERHVWQGDRKANKIASAEAAMWMALEHIRGH
jgi:hypothetical protein